MSDRIRAGRPAPAPRNSTLPWLALGVATLALAGGAWWFWQQYDVVPKSSSADATSHAALVQSGELSEGLGQGDLLENAPTEPENLIEPPAEPDELPPLNEAEPVVREAIVGWLGKKPTYDFVQSNDFVRRFVATVDNLPRSSAPISRWPVNPTLPRFEVEDDAAGQDTVIAAANATRYRPAVVFAQSVDMAQAASHYRRYYPLFQQAYEDLGYPGKYFNDRLITVIDHLLRTPEADFAKVHLVEVKGEHASRQPWVRYEFADPKLESLSAGQKVLVRIGADNARVIKTQLRRFRDEIATSTPAADTPAPASTP